MSGRVAGQEDQEIETVRFSVDVGWLRKAAVRRELRKAVRQCAHLITMTFEESGGWLVSTFFITMEGPRVDVRRLLHALVRDFQSAGASIE